jgi:hypothetical protein
MPLTKAFEVLALRLQEAAAMLHSEIRSRVQDALDDRYPDRYPYVIDVEGDGETGDCYFCLGGSTFRAPYEMQSQGGQTMTQLGHPSEVIARVAYEELPDMDAWVAATEGLSEIDKAAARIPDYRRMLFFERFVPKEERDQATTSDFAGKGKSFPILKQEDVSAAFRSLGRAGADNYSVATIRKNIIAIAKRKGFELPKSAQTASEAAAIDLTGDVVLLRESAVAQDGAMLAKLISPGWGSSGFYSEAMLKRDGPKAFRAGTKMYWNHQTPAEESARPEGNLDDLTGVLAEDAKWLDGPKGPGLYAMSKVYEHYRKPVDEMAKDIGLSIRAMGKAREGEAEGKRGPIIESLEKGISVDFVTTPGAGGQVVSLFEAARESARTRNPNEEQHDMTKEEVQAIVTTQVTEALKPLQAENAQLREQHARSSAPTIIRATLKESTLPAAAIDQIVSRLTPLAPLKEGALDEVKLAEMAKQQEKDESAYLARITEGGGRVVGMGAVNKPVEMTEEEARTKMIESFKRQGLSDDQAKAAAGVN